jgi:hypothetical protein
MKTPRKTSRNQMSPSLIFAAGTLVGAIAVFVPLTSAGHSGSDVERSGQRALGAVRSSAPAAGAKAVDADSATSTKQDSSKSDEPSNEGTCDVQLD